VTGLHVFHFAKHKARNRIEIALFARFRTDGNTDVPGGDITFAVKGRRAALEGPGAKSEITVEVAVKAGAFEIAVQGDIPFNSSFEFGDVAFFFRDIRTTSGVPPNATVLELRRLRYMFSEEDLTSVRLEAPMGRLTFPYRFDNTRTNNLTIMGVLGAFLDKRTEIFVSPEP
jgi:hypothetical protein